MTKQEYAQKHGLTIRTVTADDMARARTDYQRASNFIVKTKNGTEYYSKKATLNDMRDVVRWTAQRSF